MQVDLAAEWCANVEANDASPGGHGRAWAELPTHEVVGIARHCIRGTPSDLVTPAGIPVDA
eukprot:4133754-Lingulodinium_polyedra.AAC.1